MNNENPDTVKTRALSKLQRDLGYDLLQRLDDPKTVEIMLNADGKVWLERLGENMECVSEMSPARGEAVIKTIAGYHGKAVTRQNPLLEGEFPLDGSRFAGQLPPIVPAPTFAIRKRAIAIFTLDQYVANDIMTHQQRKTIIEAVKNYRNILVVGGTGSGKTTLVNAIINELIGYDPSARVFIIEDTGEIQCAADNFVQYHTSMEVSMTKLLKTTLRMRPDRILVGEVRGPEALDLLMAWNTGHPGGVATLHANNANGGLSRLELLISMNSDAPRLTQPLIGEAVNVIVHIARAPNGRRVEEIIEVSGYSNGQYIINKVA